MPETKSTGTDPVAEKEKKVNSSIDIDALAEKVFQIMKEEARVERERLGRSPSYAKKVNHGF